MSTITASANRRKGYAPEVYQQDAVLVSPVDTEIDYGIETVPLPANEEVVINCWRPFKATGAIVYVTKQPIGRVISAKINFLREVLGVESLRELLADPKYIYIGRHNFRVPGADNSKWANPFNIRTGETREDVIRKYEAHIRSSPELMRDLHELRGKTLVCWCKPRDCHGDVLARLVDEFA